MLNKMFAVSIKTFCCSIQLPGYILTNGSQHNRFCTAWYLNHADVCRGSPTQELRPIWPCGVNFDLPRLVLAGVNIVWQ